MPSVLPSGRGRRIPTLGAAAVTAAALAVVIGAPDRPGRHAARLGGGGPDDLERRPERSRRHPRHDVRSRRDDVPDGRLRALHAQLGQAHRGAHPRPAGQGAGRRQAADPLQEHGHADVGAALDALPRRRLQAVVRRHLAPAALGQGRQRQAGPDVHLQADGRPRLRRRLALPRPLAVDGGLDRRRHVRRALDRRPPRAPRRPRERRDVRPVARVPDDQRPRLRRQHAGLRGEGRRDRPVGRAGHGRRVPHLPRPRAQVAHRRRHARGHARPRPRGVLPRALDRGRARAPGSTTATWRATWRRA